MFTGASWAVESASSNASQRGDGISQETGGCLDGIGGFGKRSRGVTFTPVRVRTMGNQHADPRFV
jgi:hypothetical protein